MGQSVDNCSTSQKVAGGVSVCLSAVAMILGFWWGQHSNSNEEGWLGGFNDCTLHAVLMILGMCFTYTQALLSFRLFDQYLGHDLAKALHGLWHAATVALMVAALYYIITFHNQVKFGHLSTMHSWLGLILIFVYFQNWVLGIVNFGLPSLISVEWKEKYLPSHRFAGIMGLFLAAVVMETGIAQKNWLDGTSGCIYTWTTNEEENNPASGYGEISSGCRTSFGIGILIILNALFATYALWDFPVEFNGKPKHERVEQINLELSHVNA